MRLKKLIKFTSLMLAATMLSACTPSSQDNTSSQEEQEPLINAQEHLAVLDGGYAVYSPDKNVVMALGAGEKLCYTVSKGSQEWIRPSVMGVTVGKISYCKNFEIISADVSYIKEDRTLLGNQSATHV